MALIPSLRSVVASGTPFGTGSGAAGDEASRLSCALASKLRTTSMHAVQVQRSIGVDRHSTGATAVAAMAAKLPARASKAPRATCSTHACGVETPRLDVE